MEQKPIEVEILPIDSKLKEMADLMREKEDDMIRAMMVPRELLQVHELKEIEDE